MKIDFSPIRQMAPPPGGVGGGIGSLMGSAAGSTPYGAIAQAGIGLFQGVAGFIREGKATKQLEKLQSPTYNQNKSIMDYYGKALSRYNVNPYQSAQYLQSLQMGNRSTATGLNSLKGRGGSIGGIGKLIGLQNDNAIKAGIVAENEQDQRFAALGTATQMKAGEDRTAFDVNQRQPFERKYNLLAAKAGGGTSIANAGISNVFGGLQSYDQTKLLEKIYK